MNVEIANVILAAVVAIWGIYQTIHTRKLAKITSKLEHQVYLLNKSLDQSLERLQRANELVNKIHEIEVLLAYYGQNLAEKSYGDYATKLAEWSSYKAELRGLAFAIGDKELLDILNSSQFMVTSEEIREMGATAVEINARSKSQHLHTRIFQLLANTTFHQL
jgi:hypothetical protein